MKRLVLVSLILALLIAALPAGTARAETVTCKAYHVVQRGETLTQIANRYEVSVAHIVQANGIRNPNRIFPGQRLCIPDAPPICEFIHVVKRGETLSRIARRYGVSVADIVRVNGIANPNRIFPGQMLCIPEPPLTCQAIHVVRRGETLSAIARHYGVRVADIVRANGIRNPNRIFPGQRLCIPQVVSSP
ncbi:MAG: LysM peptidoglycan-binding domain-containing protein [Anaerolineae bacterium]|nr:LysM peptidoglycan-binding domain-containing protein [Caldilineales bacterium]MCX7851316.1 LysM peptidoglycan-binding domain-containing protein [Caldilineales bacterium]MDW8268641.1 LysM peptidoglycan-binding domain-containing protein [Anaerolineae bacterium]